MLEQEHTWSRPRRVVPLASAHVRAVEDIITRDIKEVHMVRVHPYADSSLLVVAEALDVL